MTSPLPAPGQIVQVRNRQWIVDALDARDQDDELGTVRLTCLDDDAQGDELQVLWGREFGARILGKDSWKRIGEKGFDPPRTFGAFLHSMRWNCVTATDAKLFQAPFRAGIRLDAYQLEPLARALQMPRVNLFIADDVGLGKTIEAGLIASELLLRRRLREVVVAAPPSMLQQWKEELDARFGLTFEIMDREYVDRVRGSRGFGVNPWTTFPRFLVSHRLLTEEAYLAPLRDWLGEFRPSTLLILDEAHHAAPASGSRYTVDSHLTRNLREIAGRFEHRLFLSATPHNGHSHSFSALLEILDPNRFTRGVKPNPAHVKDVMVRRLKDDIREVAGGFPVRKVVQVDLRCTEAEAPELRLASLLDAYWDCRELGMKDRSKREQTAMGLLLSGLQQRLFSSVEAFGRTLKRHRGTMERLWAGESLVAGRGKLDRDALRGTYDADDDRAEESDDSRWEDEDAAVDQATTSSFVEGPHAKERELLEAMETLAQQARLQPDARVRWLVDWIRENQCAGAGLPGPAGADSKWSDLRLIVFTEYEDTRRWLVDWLKRAIEGTDRADERIAVYHGSTPFDRREQIKRAFNAAPSEHPVRILVCTDAAREGLNLQAHCWNLVHFDVPWNPSRMEQRNGRIDRKLQPAPEVVCRYFAYTNRPEDRILETLVRKTETIRKDLGSIAKVLESRLALALDRGIRRSRIATLSAAMEAEERAVRERKEADEELEAQRERSDALKRSIGTLEQRLVKAREWIGLDHRHLKDCLDVSLEMQGVEPLEPITEAGQTRYVFPDLDRRHGADPSWASTLALLRRPAFAGSSATFDAIRPVVFEPPETVDDGTVQLHLEHRVVKRLLSRFLSQGFLHHDLSRACLAQSRDGIARVVLLGRLTVHGAGAARLHEELVPVAARWIAPEKREAGLRPFGKDGEATTLAQIEEALLPENQGKTLSPEVQTKLQASCLRDLEDLLPLLETKAQEIRAVIESDLRERAQQETRHLRTVLEDQKKRVQRELDTEDQLVQTSLEFLDPEEKRTFESNVRYWKSWLTRVESTLAREPERIAAFYEPKSVRIEPVGIAYLWPAEGANHV